MNFHFRLNKSLSVQRIWSLVLMRLQTRYCKQDFSHMETPTDTDLEPIISTYQSTVHLNSETTKEMDHNVSITKDRHQTISPTVSLVPNLTKELDLWHHLSILVEKHTGKTIITFLLYCYVSKTRIGKDFPGVSTAVFLRTKL